LFGDDEVDSLLVLSQVILSMQLGFAIIPLIHFVSDKKTMGTYAIKAWVQVFAWVIASVLVYLNVRMVINETSDFFTTSDSVFWKVVIMLGGLVFLLLLVYIIIYPLVVKKKKPVSIKVHGDATELQTLNIPAYKKIAIALDFSKNDQLVLSHAIGQGQPDTTYLLIHIVESASARLMGQEAADYETKEDQERLEFYIDQLKQNGLQAIARLGFRDRAKEIARLVKDEKADLLVIGAHGHSGLKDWIYGETINSVRHELKIPVLVVSV
jgi:manganese transport protein